MGEPKRYEIRTLADFSKVPEARLPACLAEFAQWVALHRPMMDLLKSLERDVTGKRPQIEWQAVFSWVDDGKNEITISVCAAAPKEEG